MLLAVLALLAAGARGQGDTLDTCNSGPVCANGVEYGAAEVAQRVALSMVFCFCVYCCLLDAQGRSLRQQR